jgi:DNA adenine methylase
MKTTRIKQTRPSGLIRYPGGKSKLWKVINSRLRRMFADVGPDAEYREPFFGAGAVGLSLLADHPGIRRAWLNDADPAMAALWHVVIHNPTNLHVTVEVTPEAMRLLPKSDYYSADVELLRSLTGPEDLQRIPVENLAIAKLVAHQMSFSGLGSRAGGPMTERLSRYNIDALCSKIYACNAILTSVTLRNDTCTCLDFGQMFDAGDAFFYLDPPYYAAGPQLYQFPFTPDDHVRLARHLRGESRPWLLSYDDHPVIHDLYRGWSRTEKVEVGCSINGCNKKNELLITNGS